DGIRDFHVTGVQTCALPISVGDARCVAAYVSVAAEPDTGELIGALHARGITVLLPVLGPGLVRCWGRYTGRDDLAQRAPGRPPEPSGEVLPAEALAEAEVVIAPALAIDRTGVRLGQGGGWYRSEEHTSELQSRENLVCRLLLE